MSVDPKVFVIVNRLGDPRMSAASEREAWLAFRDKLALRDNLNATELERLTNFVDRFKMSGYRCRDVKEWAE